MFGSRNYSNGTYETETNQARLAYYTSDAFRRKSDNSFDRHWLASPYSAAASNFCGVHATGNSGNSGATSVGGCAPAFCVR